MGSAHMSTPLLEISGLSAGYGEAIVLEDVSFSVAPGESIAILGRNGVGKTTLMLAIMGHASLMRGDIMWRGTSLKGCRPSSLAAKGLGWVPQERDIFPSLTVEENLDVAHRAGPFDRQRIYALLPRLRERRANMGDQLSGGEQQMLAIGRALMTNPAMLLLDEPFEGLAPIIVDELERLIAELRAGFGLSLLIVEQHAEDALRLSDRGIVIERGRIVLTGSSHDLLADFSKVQTYLTV